MSDGKVYELVGGELALWATPNSVMIKKVAAHSDPVELGEHEVEELIEVLSVLLKEIS